MCVCFMCLLCGACFINHMAVCYMSKVALCQYYNYQKIINHEDIRLPTSQINVNIDVL